ncbi:MAG: hypothetical protein N2645_19360 [Clostridia bacterium]|nr:hypothetical protein [Clostridia bacterium]
MKMKSTKVKYFIGILAIVTSVSIGITRAVTPDPGSDANPIVAQDYVDAKVGELSTKISELTAKVSDLASKNTELTAKVTDLTAKNTELTSKLEDLTGKVNSFNELAKNNKFTPIEVKAGQKLLIGDSAEVILRSGKATAIAGKNGGLSDITAGSGADIKGGAAIPANHLLLSSRDDGRGLTATTSIWVIIKGTYTIQ